MKKASVWTALISSVVTLSVVLLVMNFITGEKKIERTPERRYATDDPQFARSMSVLLGPPIVGGNDIQVLVNGDRIFPAMLAAIAQARRTITFETYIYWSEAIGQKFADALTERARAGVKVHVLLDWLGSVKMEQRYIDQMLAAGIEIERYHEPHWSHLPRLNNRTHRKLLVVDGRIGFTGGVGIADQWGGDARNTSEWRDTHFRVEGPVVAQMQAVFMDNWMKAKGKVLHDAAYFPPLEARGSMSAQVFSSSPTGGSESMQLMYLMAITAARESIQLANSYFVPDAMTTAALAAAAQRGVKVRVIAPGEHIDTELVRKASRAGWGDLLRSGIEIAEFAPTMFHVKSMVVDGLFVTVGSTNFDNRSFRLNDEANLNVLDAGFAKEQIAIFDADWKRARPISHEQWLNRPWHEKALEHLAALLKSQL